MGAVDLSRWPNEILRDNCLYVGNTRASIQLLDELLAFKTKGLSIWVLVTICKSHDLALSTVMRLMIKQMKPPVLKRLRIIENARQSSSLSFVSSLQKLNIYCAVTRLEKKQTTKNTKHNTTKHKHKQTTKMQTFTNTNKSTNKHNDRYKQIKEKI